MQAPHNNATFQIKKLWLFWFERRRLFSCSSHNKTMSDNDAPGAGPVWTQGAQLARFIKRTTIHYYTQNMKALGLAVKEKKILFYVFQIVSLWELKTLGWGHF